MKIILAIIIATISENALANQESIESNSGISSLLMFGVIFILMYYFIIRPQTKKAKEHKVLIDNLKINDEIITNAGLVGKIKKITDQFIILSLNQGIDIILKKEVITQSLIKGTIKEII